MGSRVVIDQQALATGCVKAHSSLLKCCAKNCPNYMYWIQWKHRGSWVWVFLRLSVSLKLIFIVPFNLYSISIFFLIRGGGGGALAGTASGPKSHIGRSKKWHWQGRKVTQQPKCHTGVLWYTTMQVYGAWIKRCCLFSSKTYSTTSNLLLPTVVRDMLLGSPTFVKQYMMPVTF